MALYCAIDLHSNNSVVVVIDDRDRRLVEKRIPNDLGLCLALLEPFREDLLAVAVDEPLDVEDGARELKANLSRAAGLESFDQLETALNDRFELVQTTFQDLTGGNGAV